MRLPELEDTIPGMLSMNHFERLEAEFLQLRIRASKLSELLIKWDLGMLDFTPSCPKELLREQYDAMIRYGQILYKRIQIELTTRADRSSKKVVEVKDGDK